MDFASHWDGGGPGDDPNAGLWALDWVNPRPRRVVSSGPGHVDLREARIEASPAAGSAAELLRSALPSGGGTAGSRIRSAVAVDDDLPPEGYTLTCRVDGEEPVVDIVGADPTGAFYAAQTLLGLVSAPCDEHPVCLPCVDLRDWPELPLRGTIEGFYGRPWTFAERLDHLRFCGRHKLNHYVYAPKDDPYHRDRWRDPYPPEQLAELADLVAQAGRSHVRLVFALSPGLSMTYSDPADHQALRRKAAQVWDVGVRDFALLFDDIAAELQHPADRRAFGEGAGATARAHAAVCRAFEEFLVDRGARRPLMMVPTDYAGVDRTPYRDALAAELNEQTLVWWTGADIVVGEVTAEDVTAAAESYGHRLLLWDNFPVNDFDPARVFLGPLQGRAEDADRTLLAGVTANPMAEAVASQIPLATVADYAWNPGAYDADSSHLRAKRLVLGESGRLLSPLVDVCSSWPPSADQSPQLSELCTRARSGDGRAAQLLQCRLGELERTPEVAGQVLAGQLAPWARAASDMARAGILAVRLLARSDAADLDQEVRRTRAALERAEQHDCNVLRGVVPQFVRLVLAEHERPRT